MLSHSYLICHMDKYWRRCPWQCTQTTRAQNSPKSCPRPPSSELQNTPLHLHNRPFYHHESGKGFEIDHSCLLVWMGKLRHR